MLVTFSSKADMDVLMLEKHARQVLIAAGKIPGPEIPERGVFAPEHIDQTLKALQAAIEKDNVNRPPEPDDLDDEQDREAALRAKEVVMLAQRAAPLMQMLRKAKQADTPVLWETGSGW